MKTYLVNISGELVNPKCLVKYAYNLLRQQD